MIPDERLEELASLYVLGALDGAELRAFEAQLRASLELQALVAGLAKTVTAMAGTVPAVPPPPQLRAQVLARVAPPQKIVALPERNFFFAKLFWRGLVTGFTAICLVLLVRNSRLSAQLHELQVAFNRGQSDLQAIILRQQNQIGELQQLAQTLQAETNHLARTVLALEETNRLANLRITMLNSLLADAPKSIGVTLWDYQVGGGVFVAQNLKPLPDDRDYELWVMDEQKTPVRAGVFHPDASGSQRISYKADRFIKTPGQFCLTKEIKGGVPAPTIKNLVLASN